MNNRFFIFLLIGLGMALSLSAQDKELSLKDAVIGQWREFYPNRLANLQWRTGTDLVTYCSEDGGQLMQRGVNDKTAELLFDQAAVNAALGEELASIPRIRWESKDVFHLDYQGTTFQLRWDSKKLTVENRLSSPTSVENAASHLASGQVAYTRDNNVYLQTKAGKEVAITNSEDPNIVSGQAIARQEFGITKGLFWSPSGSQLAFYQKDESKVSDYPLLDISTTPGTLRNIKYPMAGQGSEKASVGIYNTTTQKTTYLQVTGPEDQYLTNLG